MEEGLSQQPSVQAVTTVGSMPQTKGKFIVFFKAMSMAIFMIPSLIFWLIVALVVFVAFFAGESDECTVARVPVQGVLLATDNGFGNLFGYGAVMSADSIAEQIQQAEEDENIVAIVVDIDSPGGTPVAGDEIMQTLKSTTKPTVAVIRDRGTSAAYWAAVGADYIIASPVSDVGSIGVTMSYLELASSTEYQGSRWIDISSGEYKDAGHPERVLSDKEREHFQGQVNMVFEYMLDQIAGARDNLSREDVVALADGRAYLGTEALTMGLVDEVGGFDNALEYLKGRFSSDESLDICPVSYGGLGDLLY